MSEQQPCHRQDLLVNAEVTVDVDDNGMPINNGGQGLRPVDYQAYWCSNCEENFDSFADAIKHLSAIVTADGRIVRVEVA